MSLANARAGVRNAEVDRCSLDGPCSSVGKCLRHDRCPGHCGEVGYFFVFRPHFDDEAQFSDRAPRTICRSCGGQSRAWCEENP